MKLRKKFLLILIVFIGSFCSSLKNVYALNNDIIYDIDTFNITEENEMKITGWSFVDHADNWGGKNLDTYIIAYVGNYKNNVGDNKFKSCGKNNKKCLKYKVIPKAKNLYVSRCIGNHNCSVTTEKLHRDKLENGTEEFKGTSCTGYDYSGRYNNSHCLYYNVGFEVEIDLNEVYKYFFKYINTKSNVNVKFRILSSVEVKGKNVITRSTGLGIHRTAISSNIRNSCNSDGDCEISREFQVESILEDNDTVTEVRKYSKIKFGGISNKLEFTASTGTAKTNSNLTNGSLPFKVYSDFEFDVSKLNNGKSTSTVSFHKYGRVLNTEVYAVKGKSNGSNIIPGNSSTYYLPVSWGRISGTLKLSLQSDLIPDEPEHPTNEENCFCVGSDCDENSCNTVVKEPIPCIRSEVKKNYCEDSPFSANCQQTVSKEYYYKVKKNKLESLLNESNKVNELKNDGATDFKISDLVVHDNTYYYLPVTFYTNIEIKQEGAVKFIKKMPDEAGEKFVNNQPVNSGRFFNFALSYMVSASLNYLNYSDNISDNNWYKNFRNIDFCYNKSNETLCDVTTIYYDFDNSDNFYNLSESVAVAKYNGSSTGIYYKVVQDSNLLESFNDGNELKMNVTFPDSNEKISNGKTMDPGNFKCDVTKNDFLEKSYSCYYTIPQAYNNPPSGNVYYNKEENYVEMSSKGSLYYIPMSMKTGHVFEFTIKSSELSLIDALKFEYDTTCKVVSNNKLDNLRYRSIDVSNPFPKADATYSNIASNWKDYYNNYGFTRITLNSYSKISYQTKLLNSSYSEEMKEIESSYGYYKNMTDIDSDGNSKVINDSLFETIDGKHCDTGMFKAECDEVQN